MRRVRPVNHAITERGTGRLVRLGLQDVFPESGDAFGLLDRYGLGVRDIVRAVRRSPAALPPQREDAEQGRKRRES